MMYYRTNDGDMLDVICWRHYGRTSGVVEQVMEANPGVASMGAVLPTGMVIMLPDITPARETTIVRLWD